MFLVNLIPRYVKIRACKNIKEQIIFCVKKVIVDN
jgi:hypothetical protein